MKRTLPPFLLTVLITLFSPMAFTQWSDTKNQFKDSLHMPVTLAPNTQSQAVVVRSYPDSGYFVIWQDLRESATNKTDIYAQKYDKNGNALWAADGVPVATGANDQHYTYASNFNSRNYSIAATDSAGGFYITYLDDSVNQYLWSRIYVQNILSDGSRQVTGQGFAVAYTPGGQNYTFGSPQLIADGNKGFYVSYLQTEFGSQKLYGFNYKKQGGTFVQNGGGWMNEYARETQSIGPCGIINTVVWHSIRVYDYFIWPDGQGGCNVVFNTELPVLGASIGFNRLVRVKKDCTTTVYRRTTDIANCNAIVTNYKKDDVVVLHRFTMFSNTVFCSTPGPPPVGYSQLSTYIENLGHGFLVLSTGYYDCQYVKGITLGTSGNINADIIAFNNRMYTNNALTKFGTKVLSRAVEKYDSIPYELASNLTNCYLAMRSSPEGKVLDKLNNLNDSLIYAAGTYYHDFSLAGSANTVYATALVYTDNGSVRSVFLNQLKLVQASADSFALQFGTGTNKGVLIGKEVYTGFQSTSITYDDPMVVMDEYGNGVFHIREYYRYVRVSPIINATQLSWGAMGKPMGSGLYGNGSYRPEYAYLCVDPRNGTGVMSWQDERTPPLTGTNIYMRHLDSLNVDGHLPPNKPVSTLTWGTVYGTPAYLTGTSKQYSVIDAYSSTTGNYSPVVEILDNYNLGVVEVTTYAHNSASIRTHNGKPYLNRNYGIKVQNQPTGGAVINLRLYFSNADFDAIKAADPSIINPGRLAAVKQVNNTNIVPTSYAPVAGEEIITPKSWMAVEGGYYIEIEVTGFSDFFLFKNENALPVTWVNVYAQWHNENQVKVSWQVTDEVNVDRYIVQHSKDGRTFTDECGIPAVGGTNYNCIVPGIRDMKNYYRVKEIDRDGYTSYSKVVVVSGSYSNNLLVLYPNPARKVLNVQAPADMKEMTVIDAQGRNVFSYRGQSSVITINVSKFSKGIYTLMMTDTKGIKHYRKFMVE